MKRIILLGLLYFGLFGFNSAKSVTLDDVVKVGSLISGAITLREAYNAYECSNKYLNVSDKDNYGRHNNNQYLISLGYYDDTVHHSKKAFLAACITGCLFFHKEIKKLIRK